MKENTWRCFQLFHTSSFAQKQVGFPVFKKPLIHTLVIVAFCMKKKCSAELGMKIKQSAKFDQIKCASDPDLQRECSISLMRQLHQFLYLRPPTNSSLCWCFYLAAIFCNKCHRKTCCLYFGVILLLRGWQNFGGEVSISLMKLNQGHFVGIVASKGI